MTTHVRFTSAQYCCTNLTNLVGGLSIAKKIKQGKAVEV